MVSGDSKRAQHPSIFGLLAHGPLYWNSIFPHGNAAFPKHTKHFQLNLKHASAKHSANAGNRLVAWPADSSRLQTFILHLPVGSKRNHKTELWLWLRIFSTNHLLFYSFTLPCSIPSTITLPPTSSQSFLHPSTYRILQVLSCICSWDFLVQS